MSTVFDYLQGRGVTFQVIPRGRSSSRRPEVDPPRGGVVRTIVVMAHHGPALVVIPSDATLDLLLVRGALRDPAARPATDAELATAFPEYEPGALPPLSMMLLAPMYVDPTVAAWDELEFAAGRHDVSIRMNTRDLFENDPVVITPLAVPRTVRS